VASAAAAIMVLLVLSVPVVLLPAQQYSIALRMTGQQFFANGTGTAYFDDGTTYPFNHTITPEEGYYYDSSTVFVAGEIPGYEINETIIAINNQRGLGSTGDIINVTIAYGSEFLGNRSFQPTNIIKAKVGDVVLFKNEDWQSHRIISPPSTSSSEVPVGANFDFWLSPGENFPVTFTRPIGEHFES